MEPVTVIIPTLNEVGTIANVIGEIPPEFAGDIIVADSGSTDGTQRAAMAAGARVIDTGRGYGRACAMGAASADPASRVIVFLDGDGADRRRLVERRDDEAYRLHRMPQFLQGAGGASESNEVRKSR